jgi:GTP-binding protein
MKKAEVRFVGSAPTPAECPPPGKPEFALIGRSNVGKSTLVNLLCGEKGLARVSATPGRTRLINFYDFAGKFYLVDLPGYGYAKMARSGRALLEKTIAGYLSDRGTLAWTLVLIDSRLPPQRIDLEFLQWLREKGRDFALVFTKADKVKAAAGETLRAGMLDEVLRETGVQPPVFVTSSKEKSGLGALRNFLQQVAREP